MSEPKDLTPAAWAILYRLLDLAENEFSNHGCNDFEMPDTPENRAVLDLVGEFDPDFEPFDEAEYVKPGATLLTGDYELMRFFADYARRKSEVSHA